VLYLISLGLYDYKDLSLRALEALKKCEHVFIDTYTTEINFEIKELEDFIGKKVTALQRADLEEKSFRLLDLAERENVAVLVGGDALTATTHITLILDARKRGIPTRVIHGSSIYTAVCEAGLQIYKFGRTTTLPSFKVASPYQIIAQNKKSGLHTLVLLDVGMSAKKGIETLLEIEREQKRGVLTEEDKLVVCCKLGSEEQIIVYRTVRELLKLKTIDCSPCVLIVPGKLHPIEEEMLKSWV